MRFDFFTSGIVGIGLLISGCGSTTTGGGHVSPDGGTATGGSGTGGEPSSGGSGTGGAASGGAGGQATGGGSSGGSGGSVNDRCTSNAECAGGACFRGLDGARDCVTPRDAATLDSCQFAQAPCCTADADCTDGTNGRCWPKLDVAENFCGGAVPTGNDCRYDRCASDADCTQKPAGASVAVCLPAGALGTYFAQCVYGGCRTNADCTAHPGGVCTYGQGPTNGACSLVNELYCAYPSDPCGNAGQDCPSPKICVPKADYQGRECGAGPPMYP
ncbi:MAG TPA: hypothetical protein VHE30_11060 [Polyangiaceae bacterium]|nr:hypothetical protein [Polyangiaceae bacterium]